MILATACLAGGARPGRELLRDTSAIEGSFTVILVGGNYTDDANRVAILDIESDGYSFRPVTPPYLVKRVSGLTRAGALVEVEKFFSAHCAYNGYQVGRLSMPDGDVIGYEVTPDYPTALCEYGNEVTVSYGGADEDGELKVYTKLLFKEYEGKAASSFIRNNK